MTNTHLKWVEKYFRKIYRTRILENFLKLKLVKVQTGRITSATKIADAHCNLYGFIHGGTLASIADTVMGSACVTLGRRVVTIDMTISYIKGASVGSTLTATGWVVSSGKNIMRSVSEIYSGKELLARAQASYFVTGEFHEKDHPGRKPKQLRK